MRSAVLALLLLSGCAGSCQAVGGGAIGAGTVGAGSVGGLVSGSAAILPPGDPDLWFAARKETAYNDTDAVGTATDFGLLAKDATQGTAGAKPAFRSPCVASSLNDLPCFRFDGGDNLDTASFTAGDQPILLCAIGANATSIGTEFFVDKTTAGSTNRVAIWHSATAYNGFAGSATISGGTPTLGQYEVMCLTGAGASSTLHVDGTQVASGNAGTAVLAALRLGKSNSGTGGLTGDILEVLYYEDPGALTYADVDSYAASVYGSLPQ